METTAHRKATETVGYDPTAISRTSAGNAVSAGTAGPGVDQGRVQIHTDRGTR
jgi:hypothetical protein